jgi:hypothetical protein
MINKRDCTHGQLARSCHVCELEKENAELKAAYYEASVIAKKWATRGLRIEKLEAVARAAKDALPETENGADDISPFGRDEAQKHLNTLKKALAALEEKL